MGREQLAERRPGVRERQPAACHLEHRDAQRIDVASRIDDRFASGLLGRHVRRRSHHGAGLGVASAARFVQLGDAEVDQLDEIRSLALVDEEHVVRLEVAVDDPVLVRRLQRAAALQHDGRHPAQRHRQPGLHDRLQRSAMEEIHHEVMAASVGDVEVEDLDDVVVADDVHRARLVEEALDDALVRGVTRVKHLDRDLRPDRRVLAHVDGAHPPLAEELHHLVRAEETANHFVAVRRGHRDGGPALIALRGGARRLFLHGHSGAAPPTGAFCDEKQHRTDELAPVKLRRRGSGYGIMPA